MIINFYSRQKKYLIGFFLFILLVFVPSEQADDKPIELVTGKPLIQQWLLGQTYKYQISLLAGQYIEINLQEAKSNEPLLESIKVFQGGKLIIETEEIVSFTAEKSANYQIEVKAKDELDDPDAKHISKEYSLKLTTSELNLVKVDLPLLTKKAFQDYEARFYGKEEKGAFELLKNNSRIYLQKGGRFWLGEEEFNDEKKH